MVISAVQVGIRKQAPQNPAVAELGLIAGDVVTDAGPVEDTARLGLVAADVVVSV